jgi:hypothetical protein
MNKRSLSLLLAIGLGLISSPAAAGWCKHKGDREVIEDLGDITTVEIFARAGEMEVTGRSGTTEVRARGEACAAREDMLAVMDITMQRLPDRLLVLVEMPDISGETNRKWKDENAIMDLRVDLPSSVAVIVHDSSGGMELSNLGNVEITDSSGDIEIRQAASVLIPQDSSGEIYMRDVGAVTIQVDSSGEIHIDGADSVTIANDTSGDIRLERVQGDVLIGNDSSGSIAVREVGGNFIVENDTSGGISYREVAGAVSIPESRQGS